jgi:predicted RNA-binding Zn-ribbon protein involved in translation (DUF1610 family)
MTTFVGKEVKCPDCGRKNKIPPPPAPAAPRIPAAMSGEQFELWGPDEAPMPAVQAKHTPRLHPVHCQLCNTLMYATDAQIGTKLKCPDCGSTTLARASAPAAPTGPQPVERGEEYELEEASAPEIAIAAMGINASADMSRSHIPSVQAAMLARKAAIAAPPRERPVRPPVPLIQGVWTMLASGEFFGRWALLSILLAFAIQCGSDALMGPSAGLGAFAGIMIMIVTVVVSLFWLTMAAPFFVAIVAESSEGNSTLREPPQWTSFDFFAESTSLLMCCTLSGLLSLGAVRLTSSFGQPVQIGVVAAIVLFTFPFGLLSTMLEGTPFGVLSPKLATSFFRCFGPWLLFYLLTAILAAGVAAAAWLMRNNFYAAIWTVTPIAMAAMLVDMRLLGRLAWWIADIMPEVTDDEDEE